MKEITTHRKYPELQPGIRIQYRDKNEATRAGKILARNGNTLTVAIGLGAARISIDDVIGYWKGRVKASPENMIKLEAS